MAWKWQLTMPGMTVRPARSTTRSSGRGPPGRPSLHRGDPVAVDHDGGPLEDGAVADHHPGPFQHQPWRRVAIGSAPQERATLGDVEDVGVESGDPGHVLLHEGRLVGLGLVGVERLDGLPALEEAEPVGDCRRPPPTSSRRTPGPADCGW